MGLPQLDTCCCILDLKTGNIVMGCLNAILSFVSFIFMGVMALTVEPYRAVAGEDKGALDADLKGLYVMSVILLLMFLAKFLFDMFFVYGVVIESTGIIRTYLIVWVVFFLLSKITFFLNAPNYNASIVSMEIFYICLNVYAILLSHSLYKLLNSREEL